MKERIKILIKALKDKELDFYEVVGVPKDTVRMYIDRGSQPKSDFMEKVFRSIENLNPEWWLTGEGDMFKANNTDQINIVNDEVQPYFKKGDKKYEIQAVPLYDITAAAGLHSLHNSSQNIINFLSIPNLAKCDGAIYIKGDSMYPLLKHGDMVAFQEIPVSVDEIYFGEMYIVDMSTPHREKVVVKYVQKSDLGPEFIKLVSYNEKHHPAKDVNIKKVRAMAEVKASIRLT